MFYTQSIVKGHIRAQNKRNLGVELESINDENNEDELKHVSDEDKEQNEEKNKTLIKIKAINRNDSISVCIHHVILSA